MAAVTELEELVHARYSEAAFGSPSARTATIIEEH
jgi:hypothetical protein